VLYGTDLAWSVLSDMPGLNGAAMLDLALNADGRVAVDGNLFQHRNTMKRRQIDLESRLVATHGVPTYHVRPLPQWPAAAWDFARAVEPFEQGYTCICHATWTIIAN
jgi:hypothetical protein